MVAFVVATTICLLLLTNLSGSSAQTGNASNPQPNLTFSVIYRQTNLVSDLPGVAFTEDPLLVNPWGVANSSTGPFWIANNVRPFVTIYKGDVSGSPLVKNSNPQVVVVNPPSPSSSPLPTAIVSNTSSDFVVSLTPTSPAAPAQFIFASEAGTISAWQSLFGSASIIARTVPGHDYTGLALGSNGSGNLLYAADFLNGKIDVFDKNFNLTTVSGGFVDVSVPASFHPFNIQNLGGTLYVSYAEFNQFSKRPNNGSGKGYVRKFDTDGVRDSSFAISGGVLDAPWGMTVAPAGSGPFSGDLIVGNFGSSGPLEPSLSGFNPTTGALLASMTDAAGPYLKIDKLWA
ncbi:MAG: TIGR03118 family protein, partial [Cyanobacteria bacterium 13_1_40CM_2_61_4]